MCMTESVYKTRAECHCALIIFFSMPFVLCACRHYVMVQCIFCLWCKVYKPTKDLPSHQASKHARLQKALHSYPF